MDISLRRQSAASRDIVGKEFHMVHKFTSANFDSEVLKSDIPVFVDFYADWCGPCKMMSPVVDKLAEEYDGKIKVGKLNVDDNPDIAERYNVMSIPNMVFIKGGELIDRQIGSVAPPVLKKKFDAAIG